MNAQEFGGKFNYESDDNNAKEQSIGLCDNFYIKNVD